jgi:murein DD-endopeptidase MepM/ murein hydrolase activator NlpD
MPLESSKKRNVLKLPSPSDCMSVTHRLKRGTATLASYLGPVAKSTAHGTVRAAEWAKLKSEPYADKALALTALNAGVIAVAGEAITSSDASTPTQGLLCGAAGVAGFYLNKHITNSERTYSPLHRFTTWKQRNRPLAWARTLTLAAATYATINASTPYTKPVMNDARARIAAMFDGEELVEAPIAATGNTPTGKSLDYIESRLDGTRDVYTSGRRGNQKHHALDIACDIGDPLYAVAPARMIEVKDYEHPRHRLHRNGKTVRYETDNGEQVTYIHLDRFASGVRAGTRVDTDDIIGYCGISGNGYAEFPHVHMQVKQNNRVIDPLPYLRSIQGTPQ